MPVVEALRVVGADVQDGDLVEGRFRRHAELANDLCPPIPCRPMLFGIREWRAARALAAIPSPSSVRLGMLHVERGEAGRQEQQDDGSRPKRAGVGDGEAVALKAVVDVVEHLGVGRVNLRVVGARGPEVEYVGHHSVITLRVTGETSGKDLEGTR